MGRIPIERVPATIDPESFCSRYYEPRRPVVITGFTQTWRPPADWDPDALRAGFLSRDDAVVRPLWWDLPPGTLSDYFTNPALIDYLRHRFRVSERTAPIRIWIARAGTPTHWHYDGDAMDIFNVQVRGRKQFSLVDPATPLPCYGFNRNSTYQCLEAQDLDDDKFNWAVVELEEGETLFLPRHWWHRVTSLGDVNVNLNWVWTDLNSGTFATATSVRDKENIKLLLLAYQLLTTLRDSLRDDPELDRWLRQFLIPGPADVMAWGGRHDLRLVKEYTRGVSVPRLVKRLAIETNALVRSLLTVGLPFKALQGELTRLNGGVSRNAADYFSSGAPAVR